MRQQISQLKKQHSEQLTQIRRKIETANRDKQKFKEMFEQSEAELANLNNVDNRIGHIDDLKDSYN